MNTWRPSLILIVWLLLATGLRFHNLDAQSFWNDEGNSARLSERSVALIIEGTASDVHPPLYYILLRGFRSLLGESEFALRSLSAFAGVLFVATTVPLARLFVYFGGGRISAEFESLTLLIAATSPAIVYYSQETRMYTLLPLLAALSTAVFLLWQQDCLRPSTQARPWLKPVAYSVLMAAGLYTHYFFPIVFAIHAIYVVALRRRDLIIRWVGMCAVSGLLFLPWLPYLLNGLGGNRGNPQAWEQFGWNALKWSLVGEPFWEMQLGLRMLVLLLFVAAVGLAQWRQVWRVWVWLMLPLLALLALGATDSAFYKFWLLSVSGVAILIAFGLRFLIERNKVVWQGAQQQLQWVAYGLIITLAVGMIGTIFEAHTLLRSNPAYARADYRGMAARIAADNHPNAGVILNAPNQWEVFTYYHRDGAPVYPLPRTWDYAEVFAELEMIGATHDRLYVLYWGDALQDPEHWIEEWLAANAFKASEEWVKDVRFVVYALADDARLEMISAEIDFDNQITLTEVGINAAQFLAGDIIQTAFTWQAQQALDARYKIFVHLLDQNGRLVAQKDSEPEPMTFNWSAGELITTQHGILIPANVPSGTYSLVVGLYDVADPTQRLSTLDQAGNSVDAYLITSIEIND